jgi:uncharacterized membrane protein YphA (DoxX/SURF4 family)
MIGNGTVFPTPAAPERRWRRWLHLGCRGLLAVVFLMAALTKITDLAGFEEQVRLHADLPPALEAGVIAVLPWLELTCGVCLALGYATREALVIGTVLLAAFFVQSVRQYAERDCGCLVFPQLLPALSPWWPPVHNLALLIVGIAGWISGCHRLHPQAAEEKVPDGFFKPLSRT